LGKTPRVPKSRRAAEASEKRTALFHYSHRQVYNLVRRISTGTTYSGRWLSLAIFSTKFRVHWYL